MLALRKPALGVYELELCELPEPELRPGHVILEVAAAGICGTDLHILKDEYRSAPPVTLGHEVAGRVHAVAEDVKGWKVGQRVVTETYFATCGHCAFCRGGRPNLCAERRSIGSFRDGGFAPFVLVPATGLHALPEGLGFPEAALVEPLACVVRGLLELGTVRAGDLVLVTGPGAIGILAVQVAKAAGARVGVLGAPGDGARLALAKELGADVTIELAGEGPEEVLEELGSAPDVVIECSGAAPAAALLLGAVKKGGRFIQVGLYGKPVTLDIDQLCYKELELTGSFATTPSSWRRALALAGSGAVSLAGMVGQVCLSAERVASGLCRGDEPHAGQGLACARGYSSLRHWKLLHPTFRTPQLRSSILSKCFRDGKIGINPSRCSKETFFGYHSFSGTAPALVAGKPQALTQDPTKAIVKSPRDDHHVDLGIENHVTDGSSSARTQIPKRLEGGAERRLHVLSFY